MIILLLAVLAAGFYLSRQENGQTSLRSRKQQAYPVRNTDLEQLKTQEFLGALPSLEGAGSLALKSGSERGPLQSGAANTADPFKRPDHKRFSQKPKHLQPGHGAWPSSPTNMYEQAVQSVGENKAHQAAFAGRSGRAYPTHTKGSFAPLASEDKTAHAAQTLLPYTASLPKKQRGALEKQLNGLSDKVEEAILRAMLPKSKKDMNIEKYLSRNSQTAQEGTSSQNAGPFASVDRQLARQKTGIVKSMKEAFGTKAANQAGKLMDGYRQELMGMLNQPGLTTEQIKEKTRQIS
ncbi:MAG: hypothetical protein MJ053_06615, partial [Elusimicrobiaceae bacterium]|nr:hypothetical protein [Elusimicrobiaceae bacterium]